MQIKNWYMDSSWTFTCFPYYWQLTFLADQYCQRCHYDCSMHNALKAWRLPSSCEIHCFVELLKTLLMSTAPVLFLWDLVNYTPWSYQVFFISLITLHVSTIFNLSFQVQEYWTTWVLITQLFDSLMVILWSPEPSGIHKYNHLWAAMFLFVDFHILAIFVLLPNPILPSLCSFLFQTMCRKFSLPIPRTGIWLVI